MTWEPNWAVHPGEILAETLAENGLSLVVACVLLDVEPKALQAVLQGKAPITRELSETLARRLPMPESLWRRLQEQYDKAVARGASVVRPDPGLADAAPDTIDPGGTT